MVRRKRLRYPDPEEETQVSGTNKYILFTLHRTIVIRYSEWLYIAWCLHT